jgi:CBS domain-containing protein
MGTIRTAAESPKATLPLNEVDEQSYPALRGRRRRPAPEPRPLLYNVPVLDVMTREVVTVPKTATLYHAALLMHRHHVSGLAVVGPRDRLVGVITETDVMRILSQEIGQSALGVLVSPAAAAGRAPEGLLGRYRHTLRRTHVAAAMTPDPVFIGPDASIEQASRMLIEHKVNRLPVVQHGRLVGILSREDVVRAVMPPPA